MATAVREKPEGKEAGEIIGPSFRDPNTMTEEERTDPDYRLKRLMRKAGRGKGDTPAICSRCHHCRR